MKKLINLLVILIMTFIITACKGVTSQHSSAPEDSVADVKMPFENLVKDDVQEVKIFVEPPQIEVSLSKEQITQLVDILNEIVIYEQVSAETLVGQIVQIHIVKSDGNVLTIEDINPYLVIDDVWYNAKYEPSEKLNQFANEVINAE